MSPDWCTLLVHNRTCCGKYRILQVLIDLCNSLISVYSVYSMSRYIVKYYVQGVSPGTVQYYVFRVYLRVQYNVM